MSARRTVLTATRGTGIALLCTTAVVLAGCGSDNGTTSTAKTTKTGCSSGSLAGGGSTFQLNIQQQWSADYRQSCSGAQVNYSGVGSGAGIQQFGAGTIDFAGSDVAMLASEQKSADKRCGSPAITFPVTAGGVAIIYHLNGVKNLQLSASTLAGLFQGTIKRWNDPAVAKDNPGTALPSSPVVTYHRADGSGTTAVFSAFESAAAGAAWTLGSDKALNWPSGQGATGSDGVVQGVKSTDGGITYAEVSYATANNLPTAAVSAAGGKFVALTADTVSRAIETGFAPTGAGPNVVGPIDVQKLSGYPLSTVSYAIACSHYSDSAVAARVKAYLGYALGAGQDAAEQLGYAPLPAPIVAKSRAAVGGVG
jgi:phosphate transport system substrate-binding protein